MNDKKRKEIVKEYLQGMLYGDWSDEMLSVHLMKKYHITPEELVRVMSWLSEKLEEIWR